MKYNSNTKVFLALLATSGLAWFALPASAQEYEFVLSEQNKVTDFVSSEEAKNKTISELQEFEKSKASAELSLQSKLKALQNELSNNEDSVLTQLMNTSAIITPPSDSSSVETVVFLKPQQSHLPTRRDPRS